MSRYERTVYFERLVTMRMTYALHEDDNHGVLLIEDAIAYVDAVMTAIALEEDLETEIVAAAIEADQPGSTAPGDETAAPAEDAGSDDRRAERIARLARFFDPSTRRPADRG
jgi:hypothetical protein